MQEKFITYDLALELKGLGYDEPCFAVYGYTPENNTLSPKDKLFLWHEVVHFEGFIAELKNSIVGGDVTAPTWQDAFDFFRKEHGFIIELNWYFASKWGYKISETVDSKITPVQLKSSFEVERTYEEAQLACLRELIELVKNK